MFILQISIWNDKAKNTETSGNSPHQPEQWLGYSQYFATHTVCKVWFKWTVLRFFFDSSYPFIRETCSAGSNPLLKAADKCIKSHTQKK